MKSTKPRYKKTSNSAILFVILCTFFTATAQLLWKLGASSFGISASGIFNLFVILGFLSYGIGAILLILALKNGELSVVYPFIALSFIWVALLSIFFLEESMSFLNWFGIIFIVGGVVLINMGSRK